MTGERTTSRRGFLRMAGLSTAGVALAACVPQAGPAAGDTGEESAAPAVAAKTLGVNCYTPSEHTERSAENPFVTNAPRILAEHFKDHYPDVTIEWVRVAENAEGVDMDTFWSTWFSTLMAAGTAPEVIRPLHEIPIQNGWCLPIDDFLALPSQFAPDYETWSDSFYPSLMNSLIFGDGKVYCAPVAHPYPGVEVGLGVNMEWLEKIGMDPPASWTEQLEVAAALKEAGSAIVPWPPAAKAGPVWPLALQLLVSMLQDDCPQMDTNGDLFVGAEEALVAFRDGIIGPLTPDYRAAWYAHLEMSQFWPEAWLTVDLDALWRQGDIGMRYTGGWEFAQMMNDPLIEFERVMIPAPYITSADLPEGNDPPQFTLGDGKVPADQVTAINGADTAIVQDAVEQHDTVDEAIAWLQWITEPENNGFLVNENQQSLPAAIDAQLGSLYGEIAKFKLPQWKYSIAWWGEGLYFDNTHFNEFRAVFTAWRTGQLDDEAFFERQHLVTSEGADRYAASLEELKDE